MTFDYLTLGLSRNVENVKFGKLALLYTGSGVGESYRDYIPRSNAIWNRFDENDFRKRASFETWLEYTR